MKFIFNLDHVNLDVITETQVISDSNSAEGFVYSKECEEIIKFGRDNCKNVELIDAQNITSLLVEIF